MLDFLDNILNNPLTDLKLVGPDRHEQAGLTMPPTAIGRPMRPTVAVPQPTDQTATPTKKD